MKDLKDWQHLRIRNALRSYYEIEYFTWIDVREAIAEYTGVVIGSTVRSGQERLRAYVEGSHKDGTYTVPVSKSLNAIIEFLGHKDINLLSKDEIRGYVPAVQAPLRLLEYLDQTFDKQRLLPPKTLEGEFEARRVDEDNFTVREIKLHHAGEVGLIQVTEIASYYDPDAERAYDGWNDEERKDKRSSQEEYGGWAILTPEHNMLFFMKEAFQGLNHYYFTLASDLSLKREPALTQLVVLHHDYPLEPDAQDRENEDFNIITEAQKEFTDKLISFTRTNG